MEREEVEAGGSGVGVVEAEAGGAEEEEDDDDERAEEGVDSGESHELMVEMRSSAPFALA